MPMPTAAPFLTLPLQSHGFGAHPIPPHRHYLFTCLPPPGRYVLPEDKTCVLFTIVSWCPAQGLAYSRYQINAC